MPSLARPQRRAADAPPSHPPRSLPFAKIELRGALDQLQHSLVVPERARLLADSLRQRLPAVLQPRGGPDRSRLSSVESFFRYTEEEGKRFFEELDRDGDGRVRLEDLKLCMRRRKLPERYAHEFMRRAKRGWFADSIGWEEFASLMHEREAFTLRAYNSLQLNRSGHLSVQAITSSLKRLDLPATEENAGAMQRYLGRAEEGYISYGQFRNFALLLPPEQVKETDPSVLWFEAATFVQLRAPAVAAGTTGVALLKAALAGALASGSTTALMHPLDTLKTRIQATVGQAPSLRGLARMVPELGAKRLYLGIIPAVLGASSSHGVRTASYEAARVALAPLAALGLPGVNDTFLQGLASGVGTFLGTGLRIPNEVLKQRLQTGQHAHVAEAAAAVVGQGGLKALFRGTTATLAREVPFYVLGMVAYEQLKGVARGLVASGELSPWQTICVGALSGAIAAVATTPADVLKTRIMTGRAPAGLGALALAQRMIVEEGVASLFKGAAPRALWIAPLGAMNFAGYELAKNALNVDLQAPAEVEPPPPPPPPPLATSEASLSAAAAKELARVLKLRDAAGRAAADVRRASEAAVAVATPHLRDAATRGVDLVRTKLRSSPGGGVPVPGQSGAAEVVIEEPAVSAASLPTDQPEQPEQSQATLTTSLDVVAAAAHDSGSDAASAPQEEGGNCVDGVCYPPPSASTDGSPTPAADPAPSDPAAQLENAGLTTPEAAAAVIDTPVADQPSGPPSDKAD